MPGVSELFSDPRFTALDAARQKAVLSGIDPRFSGLTDQQFEAFKKGISGDSSVRGMERLGGTPPGVLSPALPPGMSAPPVDLDRLTGSRAIAPDEYPGMSYGSELPIPSDNFVTSGLDLIKSGVEHAAQPGIAPKIGGASKVFRGAAEIASPVMAAGLPFALAAAPVATIAGGVMAPVGGTVGKYGSGMLGAPEDVQNAMEDVGTVAGGAMGGFAAESPRLRGLVGGGLKGVIEKGTHSFHFLNPFALAKGAYQGAAEGIKSPSVNNALKPWAGPSLQGLMDFVRPPAPPPARVPFEAPAFVRPEPSLVSIGIPAAETPRGATPGGIHNQIEPIAAVPPARIPFDRPDWKPPQFSRDAVIPDIEALRASRRTPPVAVPPPPAATPVQNIQSFLDTKKGLKPIPTPPEKPVARDTGMAAEMRKRDALVDPTEQQLRDSLLARGINPDVTAPPVSAPIEPVGVTSVPGAKLTDLTGSLDTHLDARTAKIHNVYDYIATQRPELTPDALAKMPDKDALALVKSASDWARSIGRTEGTLKNPKGKYSSFNLEEKNPDTGKMVPGTRAEVIDMLRGKKPHANHPRPAHYGELPASMHAPIKPIK